MFKTAQTLKNVLTNSIKYRQIVSQLEVVGKFVQVLPVIRPSERYPNGKILLGEWRSGNYENRYTGIIEKVPEDLVTGLTRSKTQDPTMDTACEILPPEITKYVTGVELNGILKFDGPPDTIEYIYVADVKSSFNIDEQKFAENFIYNLHWFDLNKIPYFRMPADDEIWISYVIEGRKIRGSFIYSGLEERTLKSYELEQVQDFY